MGGGGGGESGGGGGGGSSSFRSCSGGKIRFTKYLHRGKLKALELTDNNICKTDSVKLMVRYM